MVNKNDKPSDNDPDQADQAEPTEAELESLRNAVANAEGVASGLNTG